MKQPDLRGEVALVTGGAGAIGAALGRALERAGATVVLADLRGDGDVVVALDVTDREQFARVVDDVRARHGSLDILVNNAGVACAGEAQNLPPEQWDRTIAVSVDGAINGILAVYPTMVECGRGRIVTTASLAGLVPVPLLVPYAAAKSALVGLSTSLRIEAARHGVQVLVACPGPVETPLLDTGGTGGETFGVDSRRYLTSSAGPPLTPDAFAAAVLDGMARNRAVVAPGRARAIWGLARFSPRTATRVIAMNVRRELRQHA